MHGCLWMHVTPGAVNGLTWHAFVTQAVCVHIQWTQYLSHQFLNTVTCTATLRTKSARILSSHHRSFVQKYGTLIEHFAAWYSSLWVLCTCFGTTQHFFLRTGDELRANLSRVSSQLKIPAIELTGQTVRATKPQQQSLQSEKSLCIA